MVSGERPERLDEAYSGPYNIAVVGAGRVSQQLSAGGRPKRLDEASFVPYNVAAARLSKQLST